MTFVSEILVDVSVTTSLPYLAYTNISLNRDPVAVTYAVVDNELLLADPSSEEINICTQVITVVYDEREEICFVDQVYYTYYCY